MSALSRRRVLVLATIAPLAGCSFVKSITTNTLDQDVQAILTGLADIVNAAKGVVPANVLAQVQSTLTAIQAAAAAIFSGAAPNAQLLQEFATLVGDLATILGPFFPQASVIAGAVQSALTLVGEILQLAGVVSPPSTAAALARATLTRTAMTPTAARAYLAKCATVGMKW